MKNETSNAAAQSLREAGNRQFAAKDFSASFDSYTKSILSCPVENPEEKSLAHANRSAALYHLELYEDCLIDIEAAIENNYPENLTPKLLLRKAKALKKLDLSEDSIAVLEKLESAMENMNLTEKSMKCLTQSINLLP